MTLSLLLDAILYIVYIDIIVYTRMAERGDSDHNRTSAESFQKTRHPFRRRAPLLPERSAPPHQAHRRRRRAAPQRQVGPGGSARVRALREFNKELLEFIGKISESIAAQHHRKLGFKSELGARLPSPLVSRLYK